MRLTSCQAFTMVEVLVAIAIAAVLIATLFGALIHVTRGYHREELTLQRSQVGQRILTQLDDDVSHVEGSALPPFEGLKAVGYEGTDVDFLCEPRTATHILNAFVVLIPPPELSTRLPFVEYWKRNPVPPPPVVLDTAKCRYLKKDPRPEYDIFPRFAHPGIFLVERPQGKPDVTYLAASLGRGVTPPRQAIWAFYNQGSSQGFPAGTTLRWTEGTGLERFGTRTPLLGELRLFDQWIHTRNAAGVKNKDVFEVMLEAKLTALEEKNLTYPDPGHTTRRTITAGL